MRTDAAADARVRDAFAEEEYQGQRLAARVRLIACAVIAVWITVENPYPEVFFYYAVVAGFAVLGAAPLVLRRVGLDAPWQRYLFPLLDVTLITIAAMVANPLSDQPALPPPVRLRLENDLYLFVFLSASMLTYSPRIVLWTGVCAAAAWTVATFWVVALPDTMALTRRGEWAALSQEQTVATLVNPHFVHLGIWGRQVVLLLVVAGSLAAVVWRVRRLVFRQIEAERARSNLSRYFSPNMVEELAGSDEPLRTTRTQAVAVLFVDIVGSTSFSATQSPETVIGLLREFHGLIARTVFEHGGTLDKFLGDGALITFGTPRVGPHDARAALRCARAMLAAVREWNGARIRRNESPVRIGIGLHYGLVVLGDIGDAQRLEFAVIGDTVNVASRLQDLTRSVDADAIVSQDLVDAVAAEGARAELAGLSEIAPQAIRGREGALRVWTIYA